jgi:hypothetical protein
MMMTSSLQSRTSCLRVLRSLSMLNSLVRGPWEWEWPWSCEWECPVASWSCEWECPGVIWSYEWEEEHDIHWDIYPLPGRLARHRAQKYQDSRQYSLRSWHWLELLRRLGRVLICRSVWRWALDQPARVNRYPFGGFNNRKRWLHIIWTQFMNADLPIVSA